MEHNGRVMNHLESRRTSSLLFLLAQSVDSRGASPWSLAAGLARNVSSGVWAGTVFVTASQAAWPPVRKAALMGGVITVSDL